MKIELTTQEQATLTIALLEKRQKYEQTITKYIECLNASKSTDDVKWYNHLIEGERKQLDSVNNILKQLQWK